MTAEEEIQKLIDYYKKLAKPTDKVRWKWGVIAGLEMALEAIERKKNEH